MIIRKLLNSLWSRTHKSLFTAVELSSGEVVHCIKQSPQLISELFHRLYPFTTYEGCKMRHPLMPLPLNHRLILMEYSSPNIAKPLHAGHLRSTVIGNVLSNLYCAAGHCVVRVNYIGDCGTQFAVIGTSLSDKDVERLLKASKAEYKETVLWLLEKYVSQSAKLTPPKEPTEANDQNHLIEKEKVDQWHARFEKDDNHTRRVWQSIREHSLEDLLDMYKRLGVKFDKIEYESDYVEKARDLGARLLAECSNNQTLTAHKDSSSSQGCFVSLKAKSKTDPEQGRKRVFLKSDGSTVYLSRDVSALMNRVEGSKKNFGLNFDNVHYVVENGQTEHLEAVRKIVCALRPEHSDTLHPEHFHIKFGRVHGMSTRKGTAILLSHILDEARSRMVQILLEKPTTKIDKNDTDEIVQVAEKLGVTAVIVNDLKRRRQSDYRFSWDSALDFGADGGISMQYTHARLCSIENQAGFVVDNTNLALNAEDLLQSHAACNLLSHMLHFEETVLKSLETMEPGPFVRFSLKLAKLSNQCVEDHKLRVKHQPPLVAQPRLVLFKSARNLLASCLNILGLPALSRV